MNRRKFLAANGAAILGALGTAACSSMRGASSGRGSRIAWRREATAGCFDRVLWDGRPLTHQEGVGPLDGFCRVLVDGEPGSEVSLTAETPRRRCGPVELCLSHRLHDSAGGVEGDLLEATLELRSTSERSIEVLSGFLCGARPCRHASDQHMILPITARGMHGDPAGHDCHQTVGFQGYLAHYLEQQASDPRELRSRALLLAPVVDVFSEEGPCRVALFGSSLEPAFFQALEGASSTAWRTGRRVRLEPGQTMEMKAYLLLHTGDATRAWAAFHQFAHQEDFQPIEWTREFRAHYYDFLSAAGAEGPRGGGYDADLEHFSAFHIGMATQHGYYLSYGDFIHPDRKEWPAMPGDPRGPVPMSLEKVRARVDATRRAGVHPMIYLHYTILDEGSPLFEEMKDSRMVDASGEPVSFGWRGPDVIEKTWKMSVASPIWRDHLVQQAHCRAPDIPPQNRLFCVISASWSGIICATHGGSHAACRPTAAASAKRPGGGRLVGHPE